jgi:hypothetical protein
MADGVERGRGGLSGGGRFGGDRRVQIVFLKI